MKLNSKMIIDKKITTCPDDAGALSKFMTLVYGQNGIKATTT